MGVLEKMADQLTEDQIARKHALLGLVAVFAVYGTMAYFIHTLNIARPKMAADLDGMALYGYSISIPGLAAAFVTLIFGKFSDMYGRRIMLLVSLVFFLMGTILSAISPTFVFLIGANALARVGTSAVMMLSYSVLGDMFPPTERSKWVGMLNIPSGIFALFGPTLGGWFIDNLSWRHLYWMAAPLLVVCIFMVTMGVPSPAKKVARRIDVRGCLLVAVASSTMILGLSFAGSTYAWTSVQVVSLLGISLIFWVLFFRAENRAPEPILDPQVLRNRTFLTVAIATLLSFFGQIGMTLYFPMFLQGVQGISGMRSGQIVTPFSVLMAFVGVPAGFLLARTKRYKWIYIVSFAILTATMFGIVFFTADTPAFWGVIAATMAGFGLGAIPTVNTMVVQNAVPKRLLGVVMGATFFCISMGGALSPAVLGSAMNATYAKKLAESLPAGLREATDEDMIASLGNSRVLLSEPAMEELKATFAKMGSEGPMLFNQTVQAIRTSMEAGLRSVFLVAAIAMLLSFLLICTVPEIPMDVEVQDKKTS
jgi:MFS family permease